MADRKATVVALSREEISSRLRAHLASVLGLVSVTTILEDSLLVEDLGVDSLAMVDLVVLVEESFSVELDTNTDLTLIKTVGQMADLLRDCLLKQAGR